MGTEAKVHIHRPDNHELKFRNEDKIIEKIREHLREAYRNRAIGQMLFKFQFAKGGIQQSWVGCTVKYRFLEGASALEERRDC